MGQFDPIFGGVVSFRTVTYNPAIYKAAYVFAVTQLRTNYSSLFKTACQPASFQIRY
jgi:hypothetical protein